MYDIKFSDIVYPEGALCINYHYLVQSVNQWMQIHIQLTVCFVIVILQFSQGYHTLFAAGLMYEEVGCKWSQLSVVIMFQIGN